MTGDLRGDLGDGVSSVAEGLEVNSSMVKAGLFIFLSERSVAMREEDGGEKVEKEGREEVVEEERELDDILWPSGKVVVTCTECIVDGRRGCDEQWMRLMIR